MAGRAQRKHSIPARGFLLKGKGFWHRIARVRKIFSKSQRFLPAPITRASDNYHRICILRFKFDSLEESIPMTVFPLKCHFLSPETNNTQINSL